MKALSIKEPWASMIRRGEKTIETRTWRTNYRGKLLLCCSKKPESDISGKAFAVCELLEVRPMAKFDVLRAKCGMYYHTHSWVLKNITPIEPFKVKGQLGLFNVEFKKEVR